MAYQQQKFHTEGSNALKAEAVEYDVFVKPQFITERTATHIIDFNEAYDSLHASEHERPRTGDSMRLGTRIAHAIKHNRLLGELFATRKQNAYRREDLIIFAKGFSVTGAAAFIMILFGV